jgi:hypothetical protein
VTHVVSRVPEAGVEKKHFMARSAKPTTHANFLRDGGGDSGTRVSRFGMESSRRSGRRWSACHPRPERSLVPVVKASNVDDLAGLHAEYLPALCFAAIPIGFARATHLESDEERSRTGEHLDDPSSSAR